MAKAKKRAVVAPKTPKVVASLIIYMRAIILNLIAHTEYFTAFIPVPSTVTPHVDQLESAESSLKTGGSGKADARDLKYNVVIADKNSIVNGVQNLADNAVDHTTSMAIIHAAGFDVKVD